MKSKIRDEDIRETYPDEMFVPERLQAIDTVIHYLFETSDLKHITIYEKSGLTHDDYYNIWNKKVPNYDNVRKLYKSLVENVMPYIARIPEWIRPAFNYSFPDLYQFHDHADILISRADRDPLGMRKLFRTYSGVYSVYRYAANLNHPPVPTREDRKYNVQAERQRIDARVVRAAMSITRETGCHWPVFKIHYMPRHKDDNDKPTINISGAIVPIRDHLYFAGVEMNLGNPLIIVTPRVDEMMHPIVQGIVIRKHEKNRIIASKVVFVKRADRSFDQECNNIGLSRSAELTDQLKDIKSLLVNNIEQFGMGSLIL